MKNATAPPNSQAKTPRKWKWWKIAIGTFGLILLSKPFWGTSTPPIQATLYSDGREIHLRNVGTKPVHISGVAVNDRPECSARVFFSDSANVNVTIKVGERTVLVSTCFIVRAAVETDEGTVDFTFPAR